jgi:uncharacterized membrane protein YfcA
MTGFIYLAFCGLIGGFLSGFFGIGGGVIFIPVLLWFLELEAPGFVYAQHVAIATSFAVMLVTSMSSVWAQRRKGNLELSLVGTLLPGIICGVLLGSVLAKYMSGEQLKILFMLYLYFLAFKLFFQTHKVALKELPTWPWTNFMGLLIGLLSSWIGIGGGTMIVPYLIARKVNVYKALATSAALSFPIALLGVVIYIINGRGVGLPLHSVGFVYLPAFAILAIGSFIASPIGVHHAQKFQARQLKKAFGLLLLILASIMLSKIKFSNLF